MLEGDNKDKRLLLISNSTLYGSTQEDIIIQLLEEDSTPVVGLREGAMLRVEEGSTELKGASGARIFLRGHEPVEIEPGAKLGRLVSPVMNLGE